MREKTIRFAALSLLAAVAVWLDQWTKELAVAHLMGKGAFPIWEHVFELLYVENRGAAFGMMQGKQMVFFAIAVVVIVGVVYVLWKMPMSRRYVPLELCLSFLCAGAVGNVIDRVTRGYVVDFFYFSLIDFPVFNVADIYVVVSALLLAVLVMFYYKEEEFSFLQRK
ncbi:MAG: signal peptidase II [bacterium]|nr:signal peptidase II [bacterium]